MSIAAWIQSHIDLHDYDDPKEEQANALTHLIGVLLSIAAAVYTAALIPALDRPSLAVGMLIYVISMLLLYGASSLYHMLPKGLGKRICRVLDHSNIYILIAGTYTPLMIFIGTPATTVLLILVWSVALAGIIFTLAFWARLRVLHVLLYLLMGWMIVFFWSDIVPFIPEGLLAWVIAGGLTYTVGVAFYAAKPMPYHHALWHLFVLGGSICFFVGFSRYLL